MDTPLSLFRVSGLANRSGGPVSWRWKCEDIYYVRDTLHTGGRPGDSVGQAFSLQTKTRLNPGYMRHSVLPLPRINPASSSSIPTRLMPPVSQTARPSS